MGHGDRERLLDSGMDEYDSKPISLDALLQAIERVLPASVRQSARAIC